MLQNENSEVLRLGLRARVSVLRFSLATPFSEWTNKVNP